MHADYTISSFAISISADEAIVSESLKREMKLEELRNQVTHLLYDFRGEYINNKMMALRNEMLANKDNPERIREVMNEMKELQKIRMAIAKKTGRSVH